MNVRHSACVALFVGIGLVPALAGPAFAAPRKTTAHAYVVRAGDRGWWRVAQAHGVTLSALLAANHATSATPIRVGQTVLLPAQAHDPPKTPRASGKASSSAKSAAHPAAPAASTRPPSPLH
jgi:LysM repeat protein